MTKVDIFSGFLGAGKTTLIKKLAAEAYGGEKLVLIENEFGKVAIDSGFLQETDMKIRELSSGCICCSLVGDFARGMEQVMEQYAPQRILVEPSGVAKLSDIIAAVNSLDIPDLALNCAITVADAKKCRIYLRNFGEFYADQLANAGIILLTRTEELSEHKLAAALDAIRKCNKQAPVITTPLKELDGAALLSAMEDSFSSTAMREMAKEQTIQAHAHTHAHGEDCCCGHDHSAGEVFTSWGTEAAPAFSKEKLEQCLDSIRQGKYGGVLRAKGIVSDGEGGWLHFDYVPGEAEIRSGAPVQKGRICVIGSAMDTKGIEELFGN